jgi:(2R)-3-sulfolactate dehydrogenase (NADP+)
MTIPRTRPAAPSPDAAVRLPLDRLEDLCAAAIRSAGGDEATASALARATVAAERRGKPSNGVSHLRDYLDALRAERMNPSPDPRVVSERGSTLVVDADQGAAQLAFEIGADLLVSKARENGVAFLSVRDCFTAGEIGHYTSQVAEQGLIALAGAHSPALMSVHGASDAVTGTNPLSFALPHPAGPRMFDQAASATAWVKVRQAAQRGEPIPEGWALDPDGNPTTDAADGADGALLPFGGIKAGNIALMVEMLGALSGAHFSLDAPPFQHGDRSPGLGLFVLALDPSAFDPDFPERAETHLQRLSDEHEVDFARRKPAHQEVEIPQALYQELVGR